MKTEEIIAQGGRITDRGSDFGYHSGFGNTHSSQAESGALPIGRNSPQQAPLGLYAEQLSGTAFTAPSAENKRSWLYRILPSVRHSSEFSPISNPHWCTAPNRNPAFPAAQLRWLPITMPDNKEIDFVHGLHTITTCGDAAVQCGIATHVYTASKSMERRALQNNDGEMLLIPEQNSVRLVTELGIILAEPGEIAVIPKGVRFRVELVDGPVRGYVAENYGAALTLPERGPIGANCLANARDFLYPVAAYEDLQQEHTVIAKHQGALYECTIPHSPFDVVAWHGNYAPYKYNLQRFSPVGATLFDHPDPSIFTVLTSPSETTGTANMDFVIFPDRWLVMEDSFRPPWYHMNVMSEFMGLIYGVYDAKPGGFVPGGMSLHNALLPHGPDTEAFDKASEKELKPEKLSGTMAFMFETRFVQHPTEFATDPSRLDANYVNCWDGLQRKFKPTE